MATTPPPHPADQTPQGPDSSTVSSTVSPTVSPALISVVIPVYNEEDNLRELVAEIEAALTPTAIDYEILLVDDGSKDSSLQVIKELAASRPRLKYLAFAENRGQSAAFAAGFASARGQVIVTMDADLQNDPADIPALLTAMQADGGYDMAIGWRAKRQDTWAKRYASKIGNYVRNSLTGETVKDTGCSLKAMRADMARKLPVFNGMHRFLPTLLKMQGATVTERKVNHRARRHGESKYGVLDRLRKTVPDLLAVRWLQTRYIDYKIKERN